MFSPFLSYILNIIGRCFDRQHRQSQTAFLCIWRWKYQSADLAFLVVPPSEQWKMTVPFSARSTWCGLKFISNHMIAVGVWKTQTASLQRGRRHRRRRGWYASPAAICQGLFHHFREKIKHFCPNNVCNKFKMAIRSYLIAALFTLVISDSTNRKVHFHARDSLTFIIWLYFGTILSR